MRLYNVLYVIWYRISLKLGIRKRWFKKEYCPYIDPINLDFTSETINFPFDRSKLISDADKLCTGQIVYFSHMTGNVGNPPDWFRNPFTNAKVVDPNRHWCDISSLCESVGDIKFIWEASRFTWGPTLARAYIVLPRVELDNWVV